MLAFITRCYFNLLIFNIIMIMIIIRMSSSDFKYFIDARLFILAVIILLVLGKLATILVEYREGKILPFVYASTTNGLLLDGPGECHRV